MNARILRLLTVLLLAILLLSGDGSFTFTVAELETAARQRRGFVALVADDQAWGIVLEGHRQKFGQGITSQLGPIRFDRMAEAFGAHGVRIERPSEIPFAIRKGLSEERPTVIHVPISGNHPTTR
jgi:acetolactate synthase-1/2/3 large subunit